MAITRNTSRTYFTDTTTVNERPNGSADVVDQLEANNTSDGIRDLSETNLLECVLLELKKTNAYLAELVGSTLTDSDLEP